MKATARALPKVTLGPPSDFIYDKRRNNWELVENVELRKGKVVLQLDTFLREDESHIRGDVMLKRAKAMGDLAGQFYAERLLAQESTIPKEWRKFVLIFTGTVWRFPNGSLGVPGLRWDDRWWCLHFGWLDVNFYSRSRLVRLGK